MCEKENPVTRKFNLNIFESLEIELAFNVKKEKKKASKCFRMAVAETFTNPHASTRIQHICYFKREGREVCDC